MSNRLNRLLTSYSNHISLPWISGLANEQRVLFAVYHKEDELKLRARIEEFRLATQSAGHPWLELDITRLFPDWMAQQKYREDYFEDPESLTPNTKPSCASRSPNWLNASRIKPIAIRWWL